MQRALIATALHTQRKYQTIISKLLSTTDIDATRSFIYIFIQRTVMGPAYVFTTPSESTADGCPLNIAGSEAVVATASNLYIPNIVSPFYRCLNKVFISDLTTEWRASGFCAGPAPDTFNVQLHRRRPIEL